MDGNSFPSVYTAEHKPSLGQLLRNNIFPLSQFLDIQKQKRFSYYFSRDRHSNWPYYSMVMTYFVYPVTAIILARREIDIALMPF